MLTVSKGQEPDDFLNEPAWTDKQIVEHVLKIYRFPDATTNISIAVLLEVERILNNNDDQCHLRIQVTQRWIESKLEYKRLRDSMHPVKLRSNSYIWNPSLNIENALHLMPIGKDHLRVYSNGLVEYSQRFDNGYLTADQSVQKVPTLLRTL
uniref:Neurotransmitter-gated ion-channel ligand-binding domain-containing protein n=1 Tax=Acrobeloides nanus TaxID=290746 RepID=A0A914CCH9_9BILA